MLSIMEELEIELFVATLDESEEIEEDKRTKIGTIKGLKLARRIMEVIIHRGTHQIGGCSEIRAISTRIL